MTFVKTKLLNKKIEIPIPLLCKTKYLTTPHIGKLIQTLIEPLNQTSNTQDSMNK